MKNNFDINVLSGNLLPVMETFQTIQGEGYFKGSSAYFIRIGGCDVGCHWCDIKESGIITIIIFKMLMTLSIKLIRNQK